MSFQQPAFWAGTCVFLLVLWTWGRTARARSWLLLAAGLVYAATWGIEVPLVLGALGGVTLLFASLVARSTSRRRLVLGIGIAVVLLPLVVLKYGAFLAEIFGYEGAFPRGIAAPIGLSYLTLSFVSHLTESANGSISRSGVRSFFASAFLVPKLVSGPITRPHQIDPQLARPPRIDLTTARLAIMLILCGLAKKQIGGMLEPAVASAFDGAAGPWAINGELPPGDVVFNPGLPSSVTLLSSWTAAVGFMAQLYADFSGYTDIALGLGLLVGIELPPNFRLPFLARSPIDFWSRWHISLSSWLRDHLYLPLAVRGGTPSAAGAIVVTMVLAGLWHGPSWTFAVWGLYHAVLIMAAWAMGRLSKEWPRALLASRWMTAVKIGLTFLLMSVGDTLFRAVDMRSAGVMLRAMMGLSSVPSTFSYADALAIVGVLLGLVVPHMMDARLLELRRDGAPVRWRTFVPVAVGILLFLLGTGGTGEGFYFYAQF